MTNRWNSDLIIPGSSYGSPRAAAERAASAETRTAARHSAPEVTQGMSGISPTQAAAINAQFSAMMPRIASSNPSTNRRDIFSSDLPKGANWDPRRTAGGFAGGGGGQFGPSSGGGGNFTSTQRPYLPEFESPDRQNYPVHRILANRYWKLFIKLDPVIGSCLDMYGEMPWSDCKLTGEGVEGDVRDCYETMWETCSVLSLLQSMTKEFLGIGEVVPHCFFDNKEGMWTYVALHNPDNLEVIDAPFIKMDPIVEFVPDDQLRGILTSSDPELQKVRESLPPELLAKLYSRQNIRINTETNATFIARKLHPYETRGTSLLSRMWRILMYEDAIFNASIATARRHAGPLKVAKLGNPQTNWIPGPEHERRFAELVAQAEMDPHAWIIYHYGLSLEAFGTTDRVMTINREWEVIERIKLAAMGVSKGFLTGDSTYASATAGLQVFLRRMGALRNYFESVWIRSKFFKPVAEINKFYKPTAAEVSHHIKVTRTAQELKEQHRLIIPKIEWSTKLNPNVDNDLIAAYEKLEGMGLRVSKTKKMAVVNLSFEDELRKSMEEDKLENRVREEYGVSKEKVDPKDIQKVIDKTDETKQDEDKTPPAGGPRGLQPPPNPRGPQQGTPKPVIPEESEKVSSTEEPPKSKQQPKPAETQKLGNWDSNDIEDLVELLQTGDTESAHWSKLKPRRELVTKTGPDGIERQTPRLVGYDPAHALKSGNTNEAWDQIDDFLQDEGYPDRDIEQLKGILIEKGVLPRGELDSFIANLPDDHENLSDEQFGNLFASTMGPKLPFDGRDPIRKGHVKTLSKSDSFLVGKGADVDLQRREGQATTFIEALMDPSSNAYDVRLSGPKVIASNEDFAKVIHGVNCTCHRVSIKTPDFDAPQNHESREHWQERLDKSKITPDAKLFVRQIENEVVDGWEKAFEKLWDSVQKRLELRVPIDSATLAQLVSENIRSQIKHLDHDALDNAWTGLYSEGKDHAFKPTNFRKKKLDRLQSRTSNRIAMTKEAITIDTHEDSLMLQQIKQNALSKVKSITDKDLREKILQKLTEPGAENQNPLDLANQIIKEQAQAKRDEMEGASKEQKAKLRQQIKDLYEKQQFQLQRIMRTEAINGFVKAQLLGYKEQGIEKVQWNSLNDLKVCNLCKTLNGQAFEINYLLSEGGSSPLTFLSHPQCRCAFSPIIAYVTLDEFISDYERTHPSKFAPGDTVFDGSKLDPTDVLQDEVTIGNTDFQKVPVEHVDELKDVGKAITDSNYSKHAPAQVRFVQDVYDTDEYQLQKDKPEASLKNSLVSWRDPKTDTTLVSSYASEFEPIGATYLRDWAEQVWNKEPKLQKSWVDLFKTTPERNAAPSVSPKTLEILRTTFKPFPMGQTYYLDNKESLGLTKRLRTMSQTQLEKALTELKIRKPDIQTIMGWREKSPIWDLSTGDVSESDQTSEHGFVNHEASLTPHNFFVETCRAFVSEPHELRAKDPKLFDIVKAEIFGGKDFLNE